jgi:hypothetical protein
MKASINLLPNEYAFTEKQHKRFSLVQTFSVVAILIVFLVASIVVAMRIIQSKDVTNAKNQIGKLENEIADSKAKEETLFLLKNRLSGISKVANSPSKQLENYAYTQDNLPQEISISSVTVDRLGSLTMGLLVPNSDLLGRLVGVMTDEASFQKFKQVTVESLSRGQDGIYKLNLRIVPK